MEPCIQRTRAGPAPTPAPQRAGEPLQPVSATEGRVSFLPGEEEGAGLKKAQVPAAGRPFRTLRRGQGQGRGEAGCGARWWVGSGCPAPGLSSPDNLTQETCGPCDSVKSETRPGHKEADWPWPLSPLQQPACPRASARGCRRQLGQEAHPAGSKCGARSVRTVGCPPTHGRWHPGAPLQGGPSCPPWGRTAASLRGPRSGQRGRRRE